MTRVALFALTVLLASAAVRAADAPEAVFAGTARIGTDTRQATFRFGCSSNRGPNLTGVLGVELEIPRAAELMPAFDVIPFEGPDAEAGALTHLEASGGTAKARDDFTASGWYPVADSGTSFAWGVNASRRAAKEMRKLAPVLRPLTGGGGRLVWRQGNAAKGGPPLIATLAFGPVETERLKAAIGACLPGG